MSEEQPTQHVTRARHDRNGEVAAYGKAIDEAVSTSALYDRARNGLKWDFDSCSVTLAVGERTVLSAGNLSSKIGNCLQEALQVEFRYQRASNPVQRFKRLSFFSQFLLASF